MKNILKKLSNTRTVCAIVSSFILILQTIGFEIDNEKVMFVVNAMCTIMILLGIMNCDGMDSTKWDE